MRLSRGSVVLVALLLVGPAVGSPPGAADPAASRGAERIDPLDWRESSPWSRAPLRCLDGRLSPTCACGRKSYRGCCAGHGGVDACSIAAPALTAPRSTPRDPDSAHLG